MNPFWQHFTTTLKNVSLRYFVFAGIVWLIWYVLLKNKISFKKIQLRFPVKKDYKREIFYSVITMLIFALVPATILGTSIRQHTFFYTDIHQYGMLWFGLAFPVMFIIHDAYFYWMHRLMHHPKLFKLFHVVHHKSTNPSPWAAYSFQPTEALVEAGIFVVFVFIMPITFWHFFFFFLFMIIYNVYGHLGYELYPKNFNKHWLGKWINTSVNHNQHHQFFKGNYGLYFLWWDRWMGTLRNDYDLQFDEVKNRMKREI